EEAAWLSVLAGEDVTECWDGVPLPKIDLMQVAGNEDVTVGNSVASGHLLCNGDDARPIDGGDANLRRMMRQRDAPNARASRQVQHRHRRVRFRYVKCLSCAWAPA